MGGKRTQRHQSRDTASTCPLQAVASGRNPQETRYKANSNVSKLFPPCVRPTGTTVTILGAAQGRRFVPCPIAGLSFCCSISVPFGRRI